MQLWQASATLGCTASIYCWSSGGCSQISCPVFLVDGLFGSSVSRRRKNRWIKCTERGASERRQWSLIQIGGREVVSGQCLLDNYHRIWCHTSIYHCLGTDYDVIVVAYYYPIWSQLSHMVAQDHICRRNAQNDTYTGPYSDCYPLVINIDMKSHHF